MSKYIESFVRHALTGFGAVMVYYGVSEAQVEGVINTAAPILAGVISYGVGQALSLIDKSVRR